MYQEAYKKLELEEVALILDRFNPEFEGSVFDPVETTILAQDLSFYPGCKLFDISDHSITPMRRRFIVQGPDDYFVINFSNEPIYKFNQKIPIQLNANTIADYVRFFFTYVRGRHGRFLIVENVDDLNWRDDPPPSARKAVSELIDPLILEKEDKDAFYLRGCMMFKDSLFKSLIKVESDGMVSLHEEELLVEDMPVLDDVFGQ